MMIDSQKWGSCLFPGILLVAVDNFCLEIGRHYPGQPNLKGCVPASYLITLKKSCGRAQCCDHTTQNPRRPKSMESRKNCRTTTLASLLEYPNYPKNVISSTEVYTFILPHTSFVFNDHHNKRMIFQ